MTGGAGYPTNTDDPERFTKILLRLASLSPNLIERSCGQAFEAGAISIARLILDSVMYFPDLSNYAQLMREPLPDVLNVGWLDQSMPFSTGTVQPSFLDRLENWIRVGRVNPMRGIYQCNICRVSQWPLLPLEENPSVNIEGKRLFLGNWEIWIPGRHGRIFASPALIIHYVRVHGYRPPEEFVAAVIDEKAIDEWNAEAEFRKRTTIVKP